MVDWLRYAFINKTTTRMEKFCVALDSIGYILVIAMIRYNKYLIFVNIESVI